ncbi:MAG: hypothetical protein VKK04_14155 [Synechococcales bacterium]|nr:hypothetical protein [Synechococcales bacterium]
MLQANQRVPASDTIPGQPVGGLQFVATEVALSASLSDLQQAIEAQLTAIGEPLRWSITGVNGDRQTAQIEAVVITPGHS